MSSSPATSAHASHRVLLLADCSSPPTVDGISRSTDVTLEWREDRPHLGRVKETGAALIKYRIR